MTLTYTRLVATVAGVAVAAAFVAGAVAIPKAQAALSASQVSAIISLLQSFGADSATIANVQASLTGGTPSSGGSSGNSGNNAACYGWTRALQQGSVGADVQALQVFLNSSASTQVAASGAGSPGMETTSFGPATKAAVIKFQTANGISPAAGYFGPITRAAVAAKCSGGGSTGTPSQGASGDEGQLTDIDNNTSDVESVLDEGEDDVKVFGVEMEAEDSEMTIERVDVDFTLLDVENGSDNLDDYITEVTLYQGDEKLASLDVDEGEINDAGDGDFSTAADANDVYSFRFVGLDARIDEGDVGTLYVAVSAAGNVDTADEGDDWAVLIPDDGIRAVDGAGISDTYVDAADLTEETFEVGAADAGDIDLSAMESDNPDKVLVLNADSETNGVEVFRFTIESQSSDNIIEDLSIRFATTSATTTSFADVINNVHLLVDGEEVGVESPVAGAFGATSTFDGIDVAIDDGDEVEFVVEVDFKDNADAREGFAFAASVLGSAIEAEDAEGDDISVTETITGGTLETRTSGIALDFVSASESITAGAIAGDPDIANLTIVFDVEAIGDDDVYIDADPNAGAVPGAASDDDGFFWATTTNSTTGTSTSGFTAVGTPTITASGDASNDDTTSGQRDFFIDSGDTRRITFRVSIPAGGDNVNVGARLTGLMWGTTDADDIMNNVYTFDLDDFKTTTVTGLFIH